MRLELINANQLKCSLSKSDVLSRNINIDTLTYGSEEINSLFDEILERAHSKLGFSYNDTPLVIEAIPIKDGSLSIIFTRNDDPEELDPRFSKFTTTSEDIKSIENTSSKLTPDKLNKANEILNLLSSFRDALLNQAMSANNNSTPVKSDKSSDILATSKNKNDNMMFVFVFDDIDKLTSLCKIIASRYHGESFVYRKDSNFYLLINDKEHSPEEFNQICNIIHEYGAHINFSKNTKAYFSEHFESILENDAISNLALL